MILSDPWAPSDPSSMVLLGVEIIGCAEAQCHATHLGNKTVIRHHTSMNVFSSFHKSFTLGETTVL